MPDRRLSILQILRAPTGGLWRHAADLTAGLARRGHRVGLLIDSTYSDCQTAARISAMSESLALGLHKMPIHRMPNPGDAMAAFKVNRLARRLGADILHGHGAKGGLYARLGRIGNPNAVAFYTPHGGVLNIPIETLQGKLFRLVERAILPLTDGVIFESDFARRAFTEQLRTKTCPTSVIHNGLNEDEFIPVPSGPNPYDFVFVGELRHVKGLRFVLEAMPGLKRSDGSPATLVVAGDGPQRRELEALSATLGLSERVRFLGAQPAREMFARGNVVVVPSLAESLPYIVLEAAAAQKPVISTQVGGISEIFGPTADALLPAADSAALAKSMQAALDDSQAANAEMLTRLDYIRPVFNVETMIDKIENAYAKVILNRG